MKIISTLLASAALVFATVAAPAPAEARTNYIYIRNYTGYTLQNVYATPSGTRGWGNDRMVGYLHNGYQKQFWFDTSYTCLWDVDAVESDGTEHTIFGLNICTETYLDVVPNSDE